MTYLIESPVSLDSSRSTWNSIPIEVDWLERCHSTGLWISLQEHLWGCNHVHKVKPYDNIRRPRKRRLCTQMTKIPYSLKNGKTLQNQQDNQDQAKPLYNAPNQNGQCEPVKSTSILWKIICSIPSNEAASSTRELAAMPSSPCFPNLHPVF